ncbi:hypothetical protein GCM10027517_05840 [Phycicoccus ginsengisoli]
MSTLTHPHAAHREAPDPRRLTRGSWWMVPVFPVVFWLTDLLGTYGLLPLLGLQEGDLPLMARNAAGWVVETALFLGLAAAPVTGVVLAATALRRGGRAGAWTGLAVNAALVLVAVYLFADAVRMTYFPSFTFPFSG